MKTVEDSRNGNFMERRTCFQRDLRRLPGGRIWELTDRFKARFGALIEPCHACHALSDSEKTGKNASRSLKWHLSRAFSGLVEGWIPVGCLCLCMQSKPMYHHNVIRLCRSSRTWVFSRRNSICFLNHGFYSRFWLTKATYRRTILLIPNFLRVNVNVSVLEKKSSREILSNHVHW